MITLRSIMDQEEIYLDPKLIQAIMVTDERIGIFIRDEHFTENFSLEVSCIDTLQQNLPDVIWFKNHDHTVGIKIDYIAFIKKSKRYGSRFCYHIVSKGGTQYNIDESTGDHVIKSIQDKKMQDEIEKVMNNCSTV